MEKDVIERRNVMISGFKVKESTNNNLGIRGTSQRGLKESLQKTENELMDALFEQNPAYNQTIATLKQFNEYKLQLAKNQVERELKLSKAFEQRVIQNLKNVANNERKLKEQKFNLQEKMNKASEKLSDSERLMVIGELATRFSHDVKNPLALIQTQLEILQLKLLKEDDRDSKVAFLRIFYALSGVNHMAEQVLDYSHEKPLQITQTNLSDILKLCIMGMVIPEDIKITLPEEDHIIACDDYQMGIAFNNLILNSIESLEEGGEIKINVNKQPGNITIEFQDSGPGISKNILEKIFEPMFTTKQKGTGLGLASCVRVIKQHKGTINVQNNPTRFLIKLPIEQQSIDSKKID
jgi:signal transduction histidine kinase